MLIFELIPAAVAFMAFVAGIGLFIANLDAEK